MELWYARERVCGGVLGSFRNVLVRSGTFSYFRHLLFVLANTAEQDDYSLESACESPELYLLAWMGY
jgi:hypothetical protein